MQICRSDYDEQLSAWRGEQLHAIIIIIIIIIIINISIKIKKVCGKMCALSRGCCLTGRILCTLHTSCHPTLQHHNSYNRTKNHGQWNAVRPPDDGRKDARNMLRNNWLQISQYLLHLVGFSFTYLSKMHGHSNIKFTNFSYQFISFLTAHSW